MVTTLGSRQVRERELQRLSDEDLKKQHANTRPHICVLAKNRAEMIFEILEEEFPKPAQETGIMPEGLSTSP